MNQQQRADPALRRNDTAGKDAQRWVGCECCNGDKADVGVIEIGGRGGQAVGALSGRHAVDLVALGERGVERRVLEVPHQRRWIEEVDGCDAQTLA